MATRILVVDNYDSFVYTIVGYLEQLGAEVTVARNDVVPPLAGFAGVLISPGPGAPHEAGQSLDVIRQCLAEQIPLFGVCLGLQALAEVCGATVSHAPALMHGRTSDIEHSDQGCFAGAPHPVRVTRYHSLAVEPDTVPPELEVTAWTDDGIIMGLKHCSAPAEAVQFHPEAVMTVGGHRMFATWLESLGLTGAVERSLPLAPVVTPAVSA